MCNKRDLTDDDLQCIEYMGLRPCPSKWGWALVIFKIELWGYGSKSQFAHAVLCPRYLVGTSVSRYGQVHAREWPSKPLLSLDPFKGVLAARFMHAMFLNLEPPIFWSPQFFKIRPAVLSRMW